MSEHNTVETYWMSLEACDEHFSVFKIKNTTHDMDCGALGLFFRGTTLNGTKGKVGEDVDRKETGV